MILLLKALLAHLLGDFIFQSDNWVEKKEAHKIKAPQLYYHIGVHALLLSILILDVKYWLGILLVLLSHFVIDVLKLYFQTEKSKNFYFFTDQFLHFIALIIFANYYEPGILNFEWLQDEKTWAAAVMIAFLTKPSSVLVKKIISQWTPKKTLDGGDEDSLQNAGTYIGIFERLFVFGFIIAGQYSAIGFLLAAKSVFRFGDLRGSDDRKMTEYVLIGTLISFGIACFAGVLFSNFF